MLQFCFDHRHVFSLFSLGNRVFVMVSLSVVVLIRSRLQCSGFSCNLCWALLHILLWCAREVAMLPSKNGHVASVDP